MLSLRLAKRFLLSTCAAGLASLAAAPQAHAQATANQWGLGLIQAPAAWALGYTGATVTVAVADSGIDLGHAAFAGKIDNRSRNFQLPFAGAPYVSTQVNELDNGGHGTHVAGIIAAAAGTNAPGVAYDANLVVLRIINGAPVPGISDASTAAINYFAGLSNVLIYNASYGPNFANVSEPLRTWPSSSITPSEAPALFNALTAGKIIVAATGNDRTANPIAGQQPSGIPLYPFIQPAHANLGVYSDGGANYNFSSLLYQSGTIVAVTSVGQDKRIVSYAQYCGVAASWCVAAPGGSPPGDPGIWSTLPGGTYGYKDGTSMATPMVSGALAVLQQAYPGYNAQDLTHVLYATAENVGGQLANNAIYGYGMIRLDRATAGPTAIAANSVLNVPSQQMTYWSQPLVTGGDFGKTGDGYLMIAGRTVANGNVNVFGGALGVGGTLAVGNNQVNVAQGAALTGIGTVIGNVSIAGTLNAGQLPNYADVAANNGGVLPANIPNGLTSPGTLTIQGSVQLGATAFHRVNIDGTLLVPGGPGTYDKIIVSGAGSTFIAGGTVVAVMRGIPGGFNTYTPSIGTLMPFVQAQNGAQVTGQYSALTGTTGLAQNTRLDLRYSPSAIAFAVTPMSFNTFAASQPSNANQRNMAMLLDQIRPDPGARSSSRSSAALNAAEDELFNLLYGEDSEGDLAALAALSGQGQAATPGVVMNTMSGLTNIIADRQGMMMNGAANAQAAAGAQAALSPTVALAYASGATDVQTRLGTGQFPYAMPAAPSGAGRWQTWGQSFGRISRVGESNGLPGYKATSGGFVLGADWVSNTNWLVGGAFGYARTSTNSFDTSATTNTYSGALYASWMPGAFVFDGRIAVGPATTNTTRSIVFPGESFTATAGVKGWGGIVAGEAGYRFNVADVTLKPYVGLSAQVFRQASFTESSDVGLFFPAQTFRKLTAATGVWASTVVQAGSITTMPQVRVAWTRDLRDDALTSQAALFEEPFTIDAAAPGRNAALVSLNLAAWRTQMLSVYAGYTGEFRTNAVSHQIAGGLRTMW